MSIVKFAETLLHAQGKQGILKPDADGYYTQVIGGLNCYNSVGEYYVAKDSVKLFDVSSDLKRRLKSGQCRAELGHPERPAGMPDQEWVRRVMTIAPDRVCAHFADIWIDPDFGRSNPQHGNPDLVAIWGKFIPAGPFGASLKASMENKKENVAFSIRSITDAIMKNGRLEKTLTQVMNFDYVIEGGIEIATKWNTPTLEERHKYSIPEEVLVRVAMESRNAKYSNESSSVMLQETLNMLQARREALVAKPNRLAQW